MRSPWCGSADQLEKALAYDQPFLIEFIAKMLNNTPTDESNSSWWVEDAWVGSWLGRRCHRRRRSSRASKRALHSTGADAGGELTL